MYIVESPKTMWHECASAILLVALLCILIVEVDPECDVL